jgi:hypothetical protein
MTDKIEALERLARLVDQGRISDEEYQTLKDEVLGSRSPKSEVAEDVLLSTRQHHELRPDLHARPALNEVALHAGVEHDFVKPLKAHGWYGLRYFDGREYTHGVGHVVKEFISARPKGWKFWLGAGLVVPGALAIITTWIM